MKSQMTKPTSFLGKKVRNITAKFKKSLTEFTDKAGTKIGNEDKNSRAQKIQAGMMLKKKRLTPSG